jgi:hypothetical protein
MIPTVSTGQVGEEKLSPMHVSTLVQLAQLLNAELCPFSSQLVRMLMQYARHDVPPQSATLLHMESHDASPVLEEPQATWRMRMATAATTETRR